ncbi:MAG: hypothetical protein PHN88_16225 [Ignavibacteria bacterium]|nr:hypothetical protein [Ignavibacteria bacterium]
MARELETPIKTEPTAAPLNTEVKTGAVDLDLKSLMAADKSKSLMTDQPKKPRGRQPGFSPGKKTPDIGAPASTTNGPPAPPLVKTSHKLLVEKLYSCAERQMKRKYGADYSLPTPAEMETLVKDTDDALSEMLFGLGISMTGWLTGLIVLCFIVSAYVYEKYLIIMELNDKLRNRLTKPDASGTKTQ